MSKQTIIADLQSSGAKASAMVAGLSDEALDHASFLASFNAEMSAQGAIENILIWHIGHHLDSIKAAVGR